MTGRYARYICVRLTATMIIVRHTPGLVTGSAGGDVYRAHNWYVARPLPEDAREYTARILVCPVQKPRLP